MLVDRTYFEALFVMQLPAATKSAAQVGDSMLSAMKKVAMMEPFVESKIRGASWPTSVIGIPLWPAHRACLMRGFAYYKQNRVALVSAYGLDRAA